MQIRVYYEDTDCEGIVYHANYLKFCERARSEVLFKNNYLSSDNKGCFVVKHIEANFIASSRLGDILDIDTKVKHIKKCSFTLKQDVYLNNVIIFSALIKLVYVNALNMKIIRIPDDVFNKIMWFGYEEG